MVTAERDARQAFEQKRAAWEQATPSDFSPSIESLTNKTRVLGELMADGGMKFIQDWGSVRRDASKGIVDWLELLRDPVYRGEGYPHGDKKKIRGMGGMGAINSLHYYDLMKSLRALNHDAQMYPSASMNLEPPMKMGRRLLNYLRDEVRGTDQKAAVFGHSLGSFQWMGAFAEDPDEFVSYVDQVYLDESPVPGELNSVLKAGSLLIPFEREDTKIGESMSLLRQAEAAGDITLIAIESSDDPLLRGRTLAGTEGNHYIMGKRSHIAGGANPDIVKLLSYRLVGEEVDFRRVPRVYHAPVVPVAA